MTSFYRTFGATKFDGVNSEATDAFSALDPAHERLLAWSKQTIVSELNTKGWANWTAGTVLAGKSPVEMAIPFEPEPAYLKQVKTGFPLLYCTPRSGVSRAMTLELDSAETLWGFGLVLGQLGIEDRTRLLPVLRAFPKLIGLMFAERLHPDYDGGATQFDTDKLVFSSVRLARHTFGSATFGEQGDGAPYYIAELELFTVETEGFLDVYPEITGFDVAGNGSGTPNLIDGVADL